MTWTIIISDDARAVYTLIGHHAGPGTIFKVQHTHTLKLKNIALVYDGGGGHQYYTQSST